MRVIFPLKLRSLFAVLLDGIELHDSAHRLPWGQDGMTRVSREE